MAGRVNFTINDNTVVNSRPERTNFGFNVNNLTAANWDATETAVGQLITALGNVSIGVIYKTQTAQVNENPDVPASSPLAQRENKWRVTMVGGGETTNFTIGCADLTLLEANTENMADNAQRAALITALEALVTASDGTTPMTVQLPIVFVGRNS